MTAGHCTAQRRGIQLIHGGGQPLTALVAVCQQTSVQGIILGPCCLASRGSPCRSLPTALTLQAIDDAVEAGGITEKFARKAKKAYVTLHQAFLESTTRCQTFKEKASTTESQLAVQPQALRPSDLKIHIA